MGKGHDKYHQQCGSYRGLEVIYIKSIIRIIRIPHITYTHDFDNLEEMKQFFENHKLAKLPKMKQEI